MPFDESHVDDDLLALLALGEDAGSPSDLTHLEGCRRCTAELAALTEVAGLARSGAADGPLVAPSPEVWDRISSELGLGQPGVVSLDARRERRRPWRWVAGAAAAGLLIGGVGAWWVGSQDDPATVVATAALDPLPGWDASGSAVVETRSDGTRVLVIDLDSTETSDDGFREVWLLTPDVSGLVSIGTLAGTTGQFVLPDGLDLDEFSVVDVSEEQFDGDPAHSGDSIVRGPLEA